jgi:nicotinate-nucleotide pyrophosphorylase (carboxylating)
MLRLSFNVLALDPAEIGAAVRAALAEDIGPGDVTTLATIPEASTARAQMLAREPFVVAGLAFAVAAWRELDPRVSLQEQMGDGTSVEAGATLLSVHGPARCLLSGERVALNFVQRLSGIATLTRRFVDAVSGTRARILDTRKTTPGWRRFEKYAVACGGGQNHRLGLFDMVLIKDNHLAALAGQPPHAVGAAVQRARLQFPQLQVEIEVKNLSELDQALEARPDVILLDNMSLEMMRAAVQRIAGLAKTEASGGMRLERVRAVAETGVDFISVGALTHSARAADIALEFEPSQACAADIAPAALPVPRTR